MALVTDKTFLNVTLVDAAGNRSNMRFDLSYADLAALNTADGAGSIDGFLADLAAVTNATVVAASFGEAVVEDTEQYGATGSEVENVALITAAIDGEIGKYTTLRIPAPVDGLFLGTTGENRNLIDTSDADLQTYLGYFVSGGMITVSDGESIADPAVTGNFKGKRIHRGSRKG